MSGYDFKNEEDVKEFLQNLGTEYRFGCYSEKRPDVCHLLADYMESIKKDYTKAGRIYVTNCDNENHPRSCYKYGRYLLAGRCVQRDLAKAYNYFVRSCELGCRDGCYEGGLLCFSKAPGDKSTDLEPEKAKVAEGMLMKSCLAEHEKACHFLSGLYMKGIKGSIEVNMSEAHVYAVKACELGNAQACANVSIMYRKGDGVEKSEKLSEKYKKEALYLDRQNRGDFTPIDFQQGL